MSWNPPAALAWVILFSPSSAVDLTQFSHLHFPLTENFLGQQSSECARQGPKQSGFHTCFFIYSLCNFDTALLWYVLGNENPRGQGAWSNYHWNSCSIWTATESFWSLWVRKWHVSSELILCVLDKVMAEMSHWKYPSGFLHPFNHPLEKWGMYHWWYECCVLTFQRYWT